VLGDDGIAVQCVGPWARDKHDYLKRYIDATRGPRLKFLDSDGGRPARGAAFIDLFGGPGRARIRDTGELIDASPLIALGHQDAPFTRAIISEIDGGCCSRRRSSIL
jgi:three-Cys-motif partner protein